MTLCFCGCGRPAHDRHHLCYRQHVRRLGGPELVDDPRNLVPVNRACHAAHHGCSRPFTLRALPDSVYEFAAEVFGAGLAYEYLRRRYRGVDPRLNALLAEWERAA